ncbi:MAG: hypothetical protein ACK50Q_15660, partial [Labrys sp. (in: a-proteobacteria)]
PASAGQIDGRWYFPEAGVASCDPSYEQDDKALVISGNRWEFYESSCTASAREGDVVFKCVGEGTEWLSSERITLSGNTMTRTTEGYTFHYTRCPAQE